MKRLIKQSKKNKQNIGKPVNITANSTVYIVPIKAPLLLPWIKEWWAYVTVAPLDNNIQF